MIENLFKGIIIGLCASVPLGPIAVLCIQRTLSKGRNSGLFTGLGAAVCDTFFAAIALLSLSFVSRFISDYRGWVMLAGGIIVSAVGILLFRKNPVKQIQRLKSGKPAHLKDFFSSFLMALSNPGAFFLMLGLFAFIGLNTESARHGYIAATALTGVLTGACFWWTILVYCINRFRNRLRIKQLIILNRLAGVAIMALGLISTFQGIFRLVY